MLIKEVLQKSTDFLKGKGLDTSRLDAELLISKALNLKRIDLYLRHEQPLTDAEIIKCREVISRRGKGEPVAYINQQREFFGIELFVDKRVLVPRPETELLVERVLEVVRQETFSSSPVPLHIADLGSGSGAIGISLLKNIENSRVDFIDIDSGALDVTRENVHRLKLEARSEVYLSDVKAFIPKHPYSIIVGNPPYISVDDKNVQPSVHQFEPHLALYSGNSGLQALEEWAIWSSKQLRPGGFVIFEMGITQGDAAQKIFADLGVFSSVNIIEDLTNRPRFIEGFKNG